ncbi:hypothetical protein BHM03_00050873 [Ensete ventricosum]|nr:hypothetical protein BHM03_00050873 [Ensete ventricosum]
MLRPSVTQEWVEEYELPREQTKNRRWRRPYDMLAEATRGKVVVQVHHTRICMIRAAGELDCFSAHIRLRESGKSEDKAEVPCKYLWGTSVCNRPFSFVCNLSEFVMFMEKKKVTLHLSAPHEQGSKTSSYGLHPYRVDKRSREGC